jgi:hypothetical protein
MRLGSLVCGLLINIIYLMDFLYLQRGLESRPCREILYIRSTHIMRLLFCVFLVCQSIGEVPPPLHATDNSTFTSYIKYLLRILCTFYLSTFCLQYTFHSYSSYFFVNYFYSYSSTNSK